MSPVPALVCSISLQKPLYKPQNIKPVIQQPLTAFFTLKARVEAPLPLIEERKEDIFENIDFSDDEDSEFDALIEAEFEAKEASSPLRPYRGR